MTFEEAKSILDKELIHLDQYEYMIEFFGGEPFLNFDLIRRAVEYVLSNFRGMYHFFITTNGTKVHGEIQDWLLKYRDVLTLGLSIDGNKQAHDINRSGSFDDIDLDFFLNTYPDQTIKMTISELSLPYLAESIQFLSAKGFPISCNLAYMVDWLSEKNVTILEEQLNKLISFYLENPAIPKCNLMDFPIEILAHPDPDPSHIRKYCGCKTHMLCYDMDGKCYPCQLFSPISAGEKALLSEELDVGEFHEADKFPQTCQHCYYQRICQFCLGSNYLSTGDIYRYDEARCKLYQMIFKANAKLKAIEWKNGTVQTDDEQGLLQSILKISSL